MADLQSRPGFLALGTLAAACLTLATAAFEAAGQTVLQADTSSAAPVEISGIYPHLAAFNGTGADRDCVATAEFTCE